MNKFLVLIALFTSITFLSQGQSKDIARSTNTWFMLMNEINFDEKWFFSNELHVRRADGLENWQQFLARPAINYRVNSNVELSAGYTYIMSWPYGEQPLRIKVPENNIWQQVLLKHSVGKVGLMHRYRLEERFIGTIVDEGNGFGISGTDYSQRFRYRLTVKVPIKTFDESKEFFLSAFDELWVNLDDNFLVSTFNQNWFYIGAGYQFHKDANIQVGYLNQVIRKSDGVQYEVNPTISTSLFYNFHL